MARGPGVVSLALGQFRSLLIYVLFGAAILSLALGDELEFFAILAIALLNGVLGFVQEYRAERALSALESVSAPTTMVVRGGEMQPIPTDDVVVGDLLQIEAGDIVPADARLSQSHAMSVSEAILTGESMSVAKSVEPVSDGTILAERSSMVFRGTQVTTGRGQAVVVGTGVSTEIGRIALSMQSQPRQATPLQRDLARIGGFLAAAAGGLCVLVFLVGTARGLPADEMLLTAASLAVAAIPEGLPAAATLVLALGVQRMAARNAIVRRLSSVETLGSVNVIFTDKTGTLTENSMRVEAVWAVGETKEVALAARLCNNATLSTQDHEAQGDPTEVALLEWAAGLVDPGDWQRESELPFDSGRALMSVVVRGAEGRRVLSKGATDALLNRCSRIGQEDMSERQRREVRTRASEMGHNGLRVLAFAARDPGDEANSTADEVESELTYLGLAGMADPLRQSATDSVATAQRAGVRVVMLTGDQSETAANIGGQIGLDGEVTLGQELEGLDENALLHQLDKGQVFARVTSEHKMRIVQAAKRDGAIVAMTGDGVNDAPALRAADIGIAMGKRGTDVAREASDLVLADDDFSTIVVAIEQGRAIHGNIRRFIHFLLSCNAAEVTVVFLGLVLVSEAVLTPLQLLFVNLLTDGLPALALGVEPAAAGLMQRPPRPAGEHMISGRSLIPTLRIGGAIALSTMCALALGRTWDGGQTVESMTFATLVASQLAASLVFRNDSEPFWRLKPNPWLIASIGGSACAVIAVIHVPFLQDTFEVQSLGVREWVAVLGLSTLPLIIGEGAKLSGLLDRLRWERTSDA
jgi:Ca2+-transporting ATPase